MIIQFIYKQTFCKNLFYIIMSNLKKYKEAYHSKILLDLVSCTFILIIPFKVITDFCSNYSFLYSIPLIYIKRRKLAITWIVWTGRDIFSKVPNLGIFAKSVKGYEKNNLLRWLPLEPYPNLRKTSIWKIQPHQSISK